MQRGEGGVGIERTAGGEAAAVFEEEAGELCGDAFGKDDAFAGVAGLAGIAETGIAGIGGGLGDVKFRSGFLAVNFTRTDFRALNLKRIDAKI